MIEYCFSFIYTIVSNLIKIVMSFLDYFIARLSNPMQNTYEIMNEMQNRKRISRSTTFSRIKRKVKTNFRMDEKIIFKSSF